MKNNNTSADDDIELSSIIIELWKKKFVIFLFLLFGLICSVLYLKNSTYTYTVTLEVMPVKAYSFSSTPSNLGNQLGLITNLSGIGLNLGGSTDSDFELYRIMIFSRILAENLSKDTSFMRKVFKSKWNENQGNI